jgi:hypothetical protein
VVEADSLREVLGLDARRPQYTLALEDVVHGVSVDPELGRELLDPAAGCVGRYESGDALGAEPLLCLLWRPLKPA